MCGIFSLVVSGRYYDMCLSSCVCVCMIFFIYSAKEHPRSGIVFFLLNIYVRAVRYRNLENSNYFFICGRLFAKKIKYVFNVLHLTCLYLSISATFTAYFHVDFVNNF